MTILYLTVNKVNNKNILIIKLLEKISSLIRFGFRIDNEDKAQFSLDIRDENLFGTGTELGLLLFGGTGTGHIFLNINRIGFLILI